MCAVNGTETSRGKKIKDRTGFFVCTCDYAQNVPVSLRVLADGAPKETRKETKKKTKSFNTLFS